MIRLFLIFRINFPNSGAEGIEQAAPCVGRARRLIAIEDLTLLRHQVHKKNRDIQTKQAIVRLPAWRSQEPT
jgi:hypothetical protein